MHPEQEENLERVSKQIGDAILEFCRTRAANPRFHIDELRQFVAARVPIAPDSPGRILRQLRQRGDLDYTIVSRKDSLYELTRVATSDELTPPTEEEKEKLLGSMIICTRGRCSKPCKEAGCGKPSVALCDWPLGGPRFGQTCSRPMCEGHRAKQPGANTDFCPVHEAFSKSPHIFCPRCHMPSANPNDIEKKFCGHCNAFHDQLHTLPPYEIQVKQ
jgi:hypothetical protein